MSERECTYKHYDGVIVKFNGGFPIIDLMRINGHSVIAKPVTTIQTMTPKVDVLMFVGDFDNYSWCRINPDRNTFNGEDINVTVHEWDAPSGKRYMLVQITRGED